MVSFDNFAKVSGQKTVRKTVVDRKFRKSAASIDQKK